jgi:hypothetical protein
LGPIQHKEKQASGGAADVEKYGMVPAEIVRD